MLRPIERIHQESRGCYGGPRVHKALGRQGISVGRKRVEHLMREAALVGKVTTRYRRMPGTERFYRRHGDLKLDAPSPTGEGQQWVSDLTYSRVGGEWRYLAVVMNVYSRRVIGWSLDTRKTAELTLRALKQALRVRSPKPGLIFHTDRGVEYGARLVQNELERRGIQSSMNRPGWCIYNAHMESFFHTLKAERIHGERFKNERELRLALSGYITQFYNQRRLHPSLDYVSPAEYERMAA